MSSLARMVVVTATVLSLVVVAGCGSDTKASNDYVKAINKVQTDFVNNVQKLDKRLSQTEDDVSQTKGDVSKQGDTITQMQTDIKDLQQRVGDLENQQQSGSGGQGGTTTTP